MTVLTAKSSTIFVATGDGTTVYRSVQEIPAPLRRKLQESMQGMHTATILIADKRGQEEIIRALRGQPSHVQCRIADATRKQQNKVQEPSKTVPKTPRWGRLRNWLELLLPVAVGASLWFFIESRF